MNKVPVLVLAFNRADHVKEAMKAIREYKPDRLYLECDGARLNKLGEKEAVDATRKAMLDAVDWECEVKTLFRDKNYGCAKGVNDAITWFFKHEEYGIICEDDIILSQDFFKLCEDLLPRYMRERRIMHINSQYYNFSVKESNTYAFGKSMYCWGWASWRRAWEKMDMNMNGWPNYPRRKMFNFYGLFKTLFQIYYWNGDYERIKVGTCTSWATRWNFAVLYNDGLCINPGANLSRNIGMDGGEHYRNGDGNPYAFLPSGRIVYPLKHPHVIEVNQIQLRIENRDFFRIRMFGVKNKLRKLFRK